MQNNTRTTIITLLLVFLVITGMNFLPRLPWWTFAIPVAVIGFIAGIKRWQVNCFTTGFVAGFITWAGANIIFDMYKGGNVLLTVAHSSGLSKPVLLLVAGTIGGLLTGLALYTGKSLVADPPPALNEQL
jgi:hypothetical protein